MLLELDLSNPVHRELKRLMLGEHAIGQACAALECLTGVKGRRRRLIEEHLVTAAIVCYSRPFVGSRSAGRISAKWERLTDARLTKLHQYVLMVRDKIVAHSDEDMYHVRIIDKGLEWTFTPVGGGKKFSMVHPYLTPVVMWRTSVRDVAAFGELCDTQRERLRLAASEMRDQLSAQMKRAATEDLMEPW
jgi:hypothetical protein